MTYLVDDANSVGEDLTPTFTPALGAACDYSLTIEAKPSDDSSDYAAIGSGDYTWITNDSGFTATVLETDYASFSEPIDYTIRWHYVITDTTESSLTTDAYDYATLTMVDECYYNELTIYPANRSMHGIPTNSK